VAQADQAELITRRWYDNLRAAAAVYEAYEHSLTLLQRTPDMGRPYRAADPRLAQVRVWPIHRFRQYLIFYRHVGETVEVLHVWHGARDIAALLAGFDVDS
jgi:toxin ParE1/3/4